MADPAVVPAPAPAPPSSSPLKWILIGCGGLLLLGVLGVAGCGVFAYMIGKKAVEESSALKPIAEAHLRASPEIAKAFGALSTLSDSGMPSPAVPMDGAYSAAAYTVVGAKGSGSVLVILKRAGGAWKAVGGEAQDPEGKTWKWGEAMPVNHGPKRTGD